MGVNSDDTVGVVEVVRRAREVNQVDAVSDVVEVTERNIELGPTMTVDNIVEVHRTTRNIEEIEDKVALATTVKTIGTVLNVGAGPELPENPYEGQIWIKT